MDHSEFLANKVEHLKMVVFDLDYTLWPFWVDTHVDPPFVLRNQKVYDRNQQRVSHYKEVPTVLEKLKSLGYELAIASRTGAIDEAEQLLHLFDWNQYFSHKEIYPGNKTRHINSICKKSSTNLNEIIFFDDEHRNIRDLNNINVCSILVEDGVNMKTIGKGIKTFLEKNPKQ